MHTFNKGNENLRHNCRNANGIYAIIAEFFIISNNIFTEFIVGPADDRNESNDRLTAFIFVDNLLVKCLFSCGPPECFWRVIKNVILF